MDYKKLNIAIVGLGNIGSYLYNYLQKNKSILSKKNNCIFFLLDKLDFLCKHKCF